jgi:hypothetical protein
LKHMQATRLTNRMPLLTVLSRIGQRGSNTTIR